MIIFFRQGIKFGIIILLKSVIEKVYLEKCKYKNY